MKRFSIYIIFLCVIILGSNGCRVANIGSILPGRGGKFEKPDRPKLPIDCNFTIKRVPTNQPLPNEIIAINQYFDMYMIYNQNRNEDLNFTTARVSGIMSIIPDKFTIKAGEQKSIRVSFATNTIGPNFKFEFTVTPDCRVKARNTSFYFNVVYPYTIVRLFPTNSTVKLGTTKEFKFTITSLHLQPNYNRGFRIKNMDLKVLQDMKELPLHQIVSFTIPVLIPSNYVANKVYTFKFYVDYGEIKKTDGGNEDYFIPLTSLQEISIPITAVK